MGVVGIGGQHDLAVSGRVVPLLDECVDTSPRQARVAGGEDFGLHRALVAGCGIVGQPGVGGVFHGDAFEVVLELAPVPIVERVEAVHLATEPVDGVEQLHLGVVGTDDRTFEEAGAGRSGARSEEASIP